jgi:hypothetical protein
MDDFYIEALHAAAEIHGATMDPKAWLFSTTEGQSGAITGRPMSQADVYRMIGRRAASAGDMASTYFTLRHHNAARVKVRVRRRRLVLALGEDGKNIQVSTRIVIGRSAGMPWPDLGGKKRLSASNGCSRNWSTMET